MVSDGGVVVGEFSRINVSDDIAHNDMVSINACRVRAARGKRRQHNAIQNCELLGHALAAKSCSMTLFGLPAR
jgi:hypothetical protein